MTERNKQQRGEKELDNINKNNNYNKKELNYELNYVQLDAKEKR